MSFRETLVPQALFLIVIFSACQVLAASEVDSSVFDGRSQETEERNAALYQRILEKKATLDEVLESLSVSDKQALSNNINALKRYKSDEKVVGVLKAIWHEDVSSHPGLSWGLLRTPSVRVSIAFVLHDADSANADYYMGFIKEQLRTGSVEAKSNAAMSLGIIGSNKDIPALAKLILDGDIVVAGSAASALGMLQSPESRAALEKIAQSRELDDQRKKVVQQVLNSSVWSLGKRSR
jgi:hypothetical protein